MDSHCDACGQAIVSKHDGACSCACVCSVIPSFQVETSLHVNKTAVRLLGCPSHPHKLSISPLSTDTGPIEMVMVVFEAPKESRVSIDFFVRIECDGYETKYILRSEEHQSWRRCFRKTGAGRCLIQGLALDSKHLVPRLPLVQGTPPDVIVMSSITEGEDNVEPWQGQCHGSVLCAASGFFYTALKQGFQESPSQIVTLDASPEIVRAIVNFIYGRLLKIPQGMDVLTLLDVIETYDIPTMFEWVIQEYAVSAKRASKGYFDIVCEMTKRVYASDRHPSCRNICLALMQEAVMEDSTHRQILMASRSRLPSSLLSDVMFMWVNEIQSCI